MSEIVVLDDYDEHSCGIWDLKNKGEKKQPKEDVSVSIWKILKFRVE